ncbi:tetratricopeptide repeat protein [Cylindrospermum sp. FACHB-282]|uniref:tetratricopeptide repeat protein n=1 Tax=Cylindrospermum sp. FACHB-282 TaxID=2692794 RepID=UPI001F55247F|nr:tetratricopeptide repeat protein [Cylindrospermum sp. FACHB-282]
MMSNLFKVIKKYFYPPKSRYRKWITRSFIFLFIFVFYIIFLPITFAKQAATNISTIESAVARPGQLIEQGESFYRAGNFQEAVTVLQQAVREYESQKDYIYQAVALSNLALVYQQNGSFKDAENAIDTSLNLLGWDAKKQKLKVKSQTSKMLEVLAQTLDIQAGLQLELGRTEISLATSQQVEKFWQQLGNNIGVTRSKINQAQALRVSGFYRRALDTLLAANQHLQNQPDSLMKVAALRSLGNALQLSGDLEKSQETLEASINIAQKLQLSQDISTGEFSLGNTLGSSVPVMLNY